MSSVLYFIFSKLQKNELYLFNFYSKSLKMKLWIYMLSVNDHLITWFSWSLPQPSVVVPHPHTPSLSMKSDFWPWPFDAAYVCLRLAAGSALATPSCSAVVTQILLDVQRQTHNFVIIWVNMQWENAQLLLHQILVQYLQNCDLQPSLFKDCLARLWQPSWMELI